MHERRSRWLQGYLGQLDDVREAVIDLVANVGGVDPETARKYQRQIESKILKEKFGFRTSQKVRTSRGRVEMRSIIVAVALTAVSLPTVALAQNYVLIPGGYSSPGTSHPTHQWNAIVVSYKDGNVYYCTAKETPPNTTITLGCHALTFTGTILRGSDVVTMPPRGPMDNSVVDADFWQLNQQSGELALCKTVGDAPSCARYQLP
jgi:hypothetical protein